MKKTKVELTFWVKGIGKPGDVVDLPENEAQVLVRDRYARPAPQVQSEAEKPAAAVSAPPKTAKAEPKKADNTAE